MIVHDAAIRIMDYLHQAERDLIGVTVVTFMGEVGAVRALKLDEHHGLCFTFDEGRLLMPPRYFPVSTIRMRS